MGDTNIDADPLPECGRRVGIGRTVGFDISGCRGEDDRHDTREEAGQDVGKRRVWSSQLDHRARGQEDACPDDSIYPEQDDAPEAKLADRTPSYGLSDS